MADAPPAAAPNPRVFVRNMPKTFTSDDLRALFSKAGRVADECFVSANARLSGRFGFVEFDSVASATRAIEQFNGHVCDGQGKEGGLSVEFARNVEKREGESGGRSGRAAAAESSEPAAPSNRVFIRNLPKTFTADELRALFGQVGTIADECFVSSNRRLSGRFGFVQYSDVPSAQKAIDRFQGHVIGDQGRDGGLSVEFAKHAEKAAVAEPAPARGRGRGRQGGEKKAPAARAPAAAASSEPAPPSNRVFIRNLPKTFTADELRALFGEVGTIADECFVSSNRRLSGRFGFVQYSDIPSAQKAIDRFQGHVLTDQGRDGGLSVEFAKAAPASS